MYRDTCWWSEGNYIESVLSFCLYVGPKAQTKGLRLAEQCALSADPLSRSSSCATFPVLGGLRGWPSALFPLLNSSGHLEKD